MMRARLTPRRGTTPSMASRKAVPPLRAIGRECEGTDLIAGAVDDAQLPLAVVPELAAAVSQHRAREHDGFGAGLLDVCQHGTFAVDRLDAIDDVEEQRGMRLSGFYRRERTSLSGADAQGVRSAIT